MESQFQIRVESSDQEDAEPIPPIRDTIEREVLVEVDNLHVRFGEHQVLDSITLDIARNAATAIIGPSGCGKTTFLRCINRMIEITPGAHLSGEIRLLGKSLLSPDVNPARLRRHIGMVFQRPNPFPKSIYENVAFGLRTHRLASSRSELDGRVETALRHTGLWDEVRDRMDHNALSLSGGQQQRLCIARALALDPQVLLMDEPASALDPAATARIEDLMVALKESYTLVVVTHNLQQAGRFSDFTAFFRAGHLVEFGSTEQIFLSPKHPDTEMYVSGRFDQG